jgi:hypothetical protein
MTEKYTSGKSLSSFTAYTIIVVYFSVSHQSEYTSAMIDFIRKSEIIDYTLNNLDTLVLSPFPVPVSSLLVYFLYMLVPMAFILECIARVYLYLRESWIKVSNKRSISNALKKDKIAKTRK